MENGLRFSKNWIFLHHHWKFGSFSLKIGGELICQSWPLQTLFSQLSHSAMVYLLKILNLWWVIIILFKYFEYLTHILNIWQIVLNIWKWWAEDSGSFSRIKRWNNQHCSWEENSQMFSLQAADYFKGEESNSSANKCMLKVFIITFLL